MATVFTLVPQVVAALPAVFSAALVPQGIKQSAIFDGAPNTGNLPDEFAASAYAEDRPAVIGTTTESTYGNRLTDETFSVWNVISVATGDSTPAKAQARVAALFGALLTAIAADESLGGVIPTPGLCTLGLYEWTRAVSGQGTYVTCLFALHVQAVAI